MFDFSGKANIILYHREISHSIFAANVPDVFQPVDSC
jgi:hypothetical protein